jgi:hypothetical protein
MSSYYTLMNPHRLLHTLFENSDGLCIGLCEIKMACAASKFKYMIMYFVSCLYSLIVLQLSFGPIGWLMISEVFFLKLRDRGLSVAVLVNFDGQGASGEIIFSM